MASLNGGRVTVAGAGALGLCIALELARRGTAVTVCDPAPVGDNASGVAAGMLAPVFESVLDPDGGGDLDFLRAARDLWPAFADVPIDRSGAVYRGDSGSAVRERLDALGADWRETPDGPFSPEDWRLDPGAVMTRLYAMAGRAGVTFEDRAVSADDTGLLVLATGANAAGPAPELARLTPIKGHILRVAGGPQTGPVLRAEGVYLCPDPAAAVLGATMEPGLDDRRVDPGQAARLLALGERLWPGISALRVRAEVGVRAATPDGLPMVGWSATPNVLLAVGARRNGWLLAPLVARTIAAYLADEDPGPHAARLDPRRFDDKETRA
ncbi:MAG: FAD-dependent oxidoreductase [Caulobacter sp.]|nr:FAD-dependent oxidoreductase [Caulobacter sp.]